MTAPSPLDPYVDDRRARRGRAWVPLAGAAVAAALLGTAVDGSQATAVTSRPATPPAVASTGLAAGTAESGGAAAGTLLLQLRGNGASFTQPVSGLAPGDTAFRYVDVVETGTLDGRGLTLAVTGSGRLLPALQVALDACRGGAWSPATGRCSGATTRLLTPRPLTALATAQLLDARGPARRLPLRVSLSLADRQERAVNGVLPTGSLQGATASLRWTFSVVQA